MGDAAAGIVATVGDAAAGIEQIGSTAVPRLPAKPIIDIGRIPSRDRAPAA